MSTKTVTLCAYAKINIHLKVLAKRSDGFHTIESIFQRISLADNLSITKYEGLSGCHIESPLMQLPAENTLTRAWDVFKESAGIDGGIAVRVLKNLPAGSGIGAGSADAAAFLQALNALFNTSFRLAELERLALQIGSDVPFFLKGGAAVVGGRGEVFYPLKARSDCFGILICPQIHSSTKEAYSLLDTLRNSGADEAFGFENLERHYNSPFTDWCFVNDFQPVLEGQYPIIAEAVSDLYEQGADFARMSGSGSAVFGLFSAAEKASCAVKALSGKWAWCRTFVLLA